MNFKRILGLSLLGAFLLTGFSLLFPGIVYDFWISPAITGGPWGPTYPAILLASVGTFLTYLVILVVVGVVFSGVPFEIGIAISALVFIAEVVFLSIEGALVSLFGILLAFLEGRRTRR